MRLWSTSVAELSARPALAPEHFTKSGQGSAPEQRLALPAVTPGRGAAGTNRKIKTLCSNSRLCSPPRPLGPSRGKHRSARASFGAGMAREGNWMRSAKPTVICQTCYRPVPLPLFSMRCPTFLIKTNSRFAILNGDNCFSSIPNRATIMEWAGINSSNLIGVSICNTRKESFRHYC